MKPTKNHVFCNGCHRTKMLFPTLSKADNFIRFNREEILQERRKAPIRSYYCAFCGGYHVTSNPSQESAEYLDQLDEQRMKEIEESAKRKKEKAKAKKKPERILSQMEVSQKKLTSSLSEPILMAKTYLDYGDMENAEKWLETCHEIINGIDEKLVGKSEKLSTKLKEIKSLDILHAAIKDAILLSEEEQAAIISSPGYDPTQKKVAVVLSNMRKMKEVKTTIDQIEAQLEQDHLDGLAGAITHCRTLLKSIKANNKKTHLGSFKEKLAELESSLTRQNKKKKDTIYKKTIISIIEYVEEIQAAFRVKLFNKCKDILERAYRLLDTFTIDDDNTSLLRRHLHMWAVRLQNT